MNLELRNEVQRRRCRCVGCKCSEEDDCDILRVGSAEHDVNTHSVLKLIPYVSNNTFEGMMPFVLNSRVQSVDLTRPSIEAWTFEG